MNTYVEERWNGPVCGKRHRDLHACLNSPPSSQHVFPTLKACQTLGIFIEASSCRHGESVASFSSLNYLSGDSRWGWTFQTSDPGFGLLMTTPQSGAFQEPTWSHPQQSKRHCYYSGDSQGVGALCQEPGSATKYKNRRCSNGHIRLLRALCQEPEEIYIYFLYYFTNVMHSLSWKMALFNQIISHRTT